MTKDSRQASPSALQLRILGCGSARPSLRHNPAAQALIHHGRVLLIDCGESTQLQMTRYGVSPAKVTDIFISHMHGDHFLGLPGLLGSMALQGRSEPVKVHIFAEGAELLDAILRVTSHGVEGLVEYDILDSDKSKHIDLGTLTVDTVPLRHSMPATGFCFREKPKGRHILPGVIERFGIPYSMVDSIRTGSDFILPDGKILSNSELTTDPTPSLSYAYLSDTAFHPEAAGAVGNVSLLYHESTYTDKYKDLAEVRGHSTARQAGRMAALAGAKALLLGHYSQSIADESLLVREASEEYTGPVTAANEGMIIDIRP